LIDDSWLNDPIIKEWFTILTNKRTQENYKREMPYFLEFVRETTEYKTPTQIIESRIQQQKSDDMNEKRFWETVVIKYKNSLEEKDYRRSTIVTYLRTVLSFFSHAHVQLHYARKELLGSIEPSQKDKIIKEWIPSNEDVRLLYRMANNARDRAILLVLYQSGLSPIDTVSLKIQVLQFYDSSGNWDVPSTEDYYLAKLREKSNILQQTCISREALEEIRIMLQSRGYPQKGALFVSVHNQPLTTRDVNNIMKGIVEKALDGKVREWKTKNLRDSFMNGLMQAKIQQDAKNAMCGHQREGARKDYDLSEQTIRTLYKDAFKFLTINGYGSTSRKIEEIEKKFDAQTKTLMEMLTEMKNRVDKWEDWYKHLPEHVSIKHKAESKETK
jgi:site-specific recombinase XerD